MSCRSHAKCWDRLGGRGIAWMNDTWGQGVYDLCEMWAPKSRQRSDGDEWTRGRYMVTEGCWEWWGVAGDVLSVLEVVAAVERMENIHTPTARVAIAEFNGVGVLETVGRENAHAAFGVLYVVGVGLGGLFGGYVGWALEGWRKEGVEP